MRVSTADSIKHFFVTTVSNPQRCGVYRIYRSYRYLTKKRSEDSLPKFFLTIYNNIGAAGFTQAERRERDCDFRCRASVFSANTPFGFCIISGPISEKERDLHSVWGTR